MTAPKRMTVVDSGVVDGVQWATCRAPLYGAVNGYVLVPEGHPWRGMVYDTIPADVHGGITYDDMDGWIGFDCLHAGDRWPDQPASDGWSDDELRTPEYVAAEARRLARQVAATR